MKLNIEKGLASIVLNAIAIAAVFYGVLAVFYSMETALVLDSIGIAMLGLFRLKEWVLIQRSNLIDSDLAECHLG